MREIQLTDAHLLSEVIAFRAVSAVGECMFLIARVTLEDLLGVYLDAGHQMLDAFEANKARIGEAVEKMISGNRMATDGGATLLTAAEFSELY